ncbi:MAG: hypothetical protein ACI97A_001045 [Planctomycetota bacterium]|jgi:hypothetical protein
MNNRISLFLLVLVTLSPLSLGAEGGQADKRYGISITSETATARVFVDSRFVGQSRPGSALSAVIKTAECQVRLTSAGYLDAVHTVKLKAGKMLSFKCSMVLASNKSVWQIPTTKVILASGQTARGVVTDATKVTYQVNSKGVPHQFILGLKSHPSFRVFDSKGKEVKVVRLKSRVNGAPGYKYWEYKGGAPGPHTLEVSGDAGHFAIQLVTGLPDICETDNPRLKGRRKAPKIPGK